MEYQVNFGNHAFAVPGDVVDHFLRLATKTQLKVLLCLLRGGDQQPTPAQIAGYLKIDTEQAEEALQFWVQANILDTAGGGAPQSFAFVPVTPSAAPAPQPPAAQPEPVPAEPSATVQHSSKEIKLDPSEIAAMLEDSQELRDLFAMAEQLMGRPLNHMEQRSLLWLHSYLNIRSEVILTLLGYCISIDKYNMAYVEAIAISWAQKDILTLAQAEEEVERMKAEHTYTTDLMRLFEMKRRPTTKQKAFMEQWQAAGYPMELLKYAYEVTIENIETLNFKYMNTILEDCAKAGALTAEQARTLRETPKAPARRTSRKKPMTAQEIDEMNDYLSVANRFKEDEV